MNILYVEPYYSGSHKTWIDSYKEYSKNNIEIISLPGKKWKWRMHGGAVSLGNQFNELNQRFDLIICSDMLNLPVFKSLCNKNIQNSKFAMYFHENQLSYPWSPNDKDIQEKRDYHYAFINYTSSLISDYNFFNSSYHFNSYIKELKKYLKKMPDFRNINSIDEIADKSDVLYIGCDLKNIYEKFSNKEKKDPIILWNHRWEYDKNPELFFRTLFKIKEKNIKFSLIIVGKKYSQYPQIFDEANIKLKDEIIFNGYCESRQEYISKIRQSNILPVTSNQDFFGISIMEAICAGNYPVLPERLTYPELFDIENNHDIFYKNDKEFERKLIQVIENINNFNIAKLQQELLDKFDWNRMSFEYDKLFKSII